MRWFLAVLAVLAVGGGIYLADWDKLSLTFIGISTLFGLFAATGLYRWNGAAKSGLDKELKEVQDRLNGETEEFNGRRYRATHASTLLHSGSPWLPDSQRIPAWLRTGQAVLVSLGLLGTFVGLSYGLLESMPCIDPHGTGCAVGGEQSARMQHGMTTLLGGARVAFSKSVVGIGLGMLYMVYLRTVEEEHQRRLRGKAAKLDEGVLGMVELSIARMVEQNERQNAAMVSQNESILKQSSEIITIKQSIISNIGIINNIQQYTYAIANRPQTDFSALNDGAAALKLAATTLGPVAEGLKTSLSSLSSDKLASDIGAQFDRIIAERLAPTFTSIKDELKILRELKTEQDKIVQQHLTGMITDMEKRLIQPTAEQLRKISELVEQTSHGVTKSTDAVENAAMQMQGLTLSMEQFNQETMGRLEGFSDKLTSNMKDFTDKTGQSLSTMGDRMGAAVEKSSILAATTIEQAGAAAAETMNKANTQAVDQLRRQSNAIEDTADEARKMLEAARISLETGLSGISRQLEESQQMVTSRMNEFREQYRWSLTEFFTEQNKHMENTLGLQRAGLEKVAQKLSDVFEQEAKRRGELQIQVEKTLAETSKAVDLATKLASAVGLNNATLITNIVTSSDNLAKSVNLLSKEQKKLNTEISDIIEKMILKMIHRETEFYSESDKASTKLANLLAQHYSGLERMVQVIAETALTLKSATSQVKP